MNKRTPGKYRLEFCTAGLEDCSGTVEWFTDKSRALARKQELETFCTEGRRPFKIISFKFVPEDEMHIYRYGRW